VSPKQSTLNKRIRIEKITIPLKITTHPWLRQAQTHEKIVTSDASISSLGSSAQRSDTVCHAAHSYHAG
jgi:hypothetical protein